MLRVHMESVEKWQPFFYHTSIRLLSLWRAFSRYFLISVALSLGAVLQLSNITPGGSEARVKGRNTRWNRDNKEILKIILSAVFSLDHKDFLSVKIHK